MSGAGGAAAAPKGGKDSKDNAVAQVTGALIASGVAWSLYKSFRGRNAAAVADKEPAEIPAEVKPPSKSRPKLDIQYQVAKGDTLWSISRRYGIAVDDVRDANAIPDVNYIFPGENLVIPQ